MKTGVAGPGLAPLVLVAGSPSRFSADVAFGAGAQAWVLDLVGSAGSADQMIECLAAQRVIALESATEGADRRTLQLHARIARTQSGHDLDAIRMVCGNGLHALHLQRADSVEAIQEVDSLLDLLEIAVGMPSGSVKLLPIIETVAGAEAIGELLSASPRIDRAILSPDGIAQQAGIIDVRLGTLSIRTDLVVKSSRRSLGAPLEVISSAIEGSASVRDAMCFGASLGFAGALFEAPLDEQH
jgi:citrate lyase beta subunit